MTGTTRLTPGRSWPVRSRGRPTRDRSAPPARTAPRRPARRCAPPASRAGRARPTRGRRRSPRPVRRVRRCPRAAARARGGHRHRACATPRGGAECRTGCGAGREGDDGAKGAAAQQIGTDPTAGTARRGGGGHQQDRGAALAQMGQGVLDPGEFGLRTGGKAVLPAGVVGELVVPPVALVERRVAEHGVDRELRKRVGAQGVAGPHGDRAALDGGVQGEAERGQRGEVGVGVLRVQGGRTAEGAQQGAGSRRRVENRTGGTDPRLHEGGHQLGEARRGEGELARVGVELAAEEELEGLAGAGLGGEFGSGAQQGNGRKEFVGGGGVNSAYASIRSTSASVACFGGRTEACGEQVVQGEVQHLGHPPVRHGADLQPGGGPVPDEQQGAARVDEGWDGAGRVPGQLLPDPFTERDLGELPLVTQPLFDFGQGEGRAGLGAADRLGEVGVAASPVADGGAAHAREPGDPGRGHLCRVLRH